MKPGRKSLAAMLLLLVISAAVVWFGMGDEMKGARDMRFGIDIRGGVEAVFEPVGLDRAPTEAEVTAARNIMESRLDDRNILDREVTADTDRGYVIVRFPWKSGETQFNPEVAIAELGEMANLTFRDEAGTIMLEGKDVSPANLVESGGTDRDSMRWSRDLRRKAQRSLRCHRKADRSAYGDFYGRHHHLQPGGKGPDYRRKRYY
ncbi:MAG: hypothetical protein ACLUOI_28025 [Eisenbergiella sp.]